MNRPFARALGVLVVSLAALLPADAQQSMSKAEYYDYLVRSGQAGQVHYDAGPTVAGKTLAPSDLKLNVLDIGNVRARIRNSATLGYDRDGLGYEFPFNSGITYRWTLAPLFGGTFTVGGERRQFVSSGTVGAVRGTSDDEYEPLAGFDSGQYNAAQNLGMAFSDKPASWPQKWPTVEEMISANGAYALSPAARDAFLQNPNFDPVSTGTAKVGPSGFPGVVGGVVRAPREAYFVATDNDPTEPARPLPSNVRVDVWALQWDDFVNRNFIIYRMLFTNIGDQTLEDVYVGIHDDPDAPEQGSNEWTDDFGYLIPTGRDADGDGTPDAGADPRSDVDNDGRYTSADSLLWNTFYLWDGDDKAEGFIAKGVGWIGLKFLETPDNPATGQPRGVTTLDIFQYSAAPKTDQDAYDQMRGVLHVGLDRSDPQQGGSQPIQLPDHPDGAPDDAFGIPNSYGPDITVVAASGPYTLRPGESLPFTVASVHGSSQADLLNNATLTQILFNNDYRSASGPPIPKVTAVPGDGQITLYWDDTAEKGIYPDGTVGDPLTGNNAFEGYKIYRSDDGGRTWGREIVDLFGSVRGFIPLAIYDIPNGIQGESETRRYFDLGRDAGLQHRYVDRNVENGKTYLYAVVAYDRQDEVVPPLETPINVADPDAPNDNTVRAVPMARSAGVVPGSVDAQTRHVGGTSDVEGQTVEVVDPNALRSGTYRVTFTRNGEGQTVYTVKRDGQTVTDIGSSPVDSVALYDPAMDFAPVFDGVRLLVEDVAYDIKTAEQTVGSGLGELADWGIDPEGGGSPAALSSDYEIRFVASPVTFTDYSTGAPVTAPFEVYNTTTGEKVSLEIYDTSAGGNSNGQYDFGEYAEVVNTPFTGSGGWEGAYPDDYALYFLFDASATFQAGDVFRITTNKPLSEADVFEFTVRGPEFAQEALEEEIGDVTVVPNPFVVSSPYETGAFGVQRELQFHGLPERATIRIYSVSGELVQRLEHDGGSIERWNLQTYNGQEVSFGVYLYIVQTPEGVEETGKFAVIK